MTELVKLTPEQIQAIEEHVRRGERIEVKLAHGAIKLSVRRLTEIRVGGK